MTPVEASKKKNEKKVWSNLYGDLIYLKPGKAKFAIGDRIRISKYTEGKYLIKVTHQTGQRRYL